MKNEYLVLLPIGAVVAWFFFRKKPAEASPVIEQAGTIVNQFGDPPAGAVFNIPGLRIPVVNGVSVPALPRSGVLPIGNGGNCCCDGDSATRVIALPQIGLRSPSSVLSDSDIGYVAPPCIPSTNWERMAAPGTLLGDWYRGPRGLNAKLYAELANAGYAQTVAGWLRYVYQYPRGKAGNQNRQDQLGIIQSEMPKYQDCR